MGVGKEKVKYVHSELVHNEDSAREVVPILCNLLNPLSVLDVGCGLGTWLSVFKSRGIKVLGLDGNYVDPNLLFKHLDQGEFQTANLEQEFNLRRKFDLVLCLEVAEHLHPSSSEILVESLVKHSDTILFSAALPGQGGQNHINEKNLDYWTDLFSKHGLVIYDILRPIFWNNDSVQWWYKQNMVLFSKKTLPVLESIPNQMRCLVHPDLLEQKEKELNFLRNLAEGNAGIMNSTKSLLKAMKKTLINYPPKIS